MNYLKYAANPAKDYSGYGNIDNGIEVINYRKERRQYHINNGVSAEEAHILACNETNLKFGTV